MKSPRVPARQAGISLIEALAALAVVAVGLVSVVGMQSTVRSNADNARQRAEAVRIAQRQMEQMRSFDRIAADASLDWWRTFDGQPSTSSAEVTGLTNTNTTFTMTASRLSAAAGGSTAQPYRALAVSVSWPDRSGGTQTVSLASATHRAGPELSAAVQLQGDRGPSARPQGRASVIPSVAVDNGDGSSTLALPGSASFTFSNQTGLITQVCRGTSSCTPVNNALLAGYVRFSVDGNPAGTSELPPSASMSVDVALALTLPATGTATCYNQRMSDHVAYYCAVPISGTRVWSGQSTVTSLNVASSASDARNSRYRVCRYTPELTDTPSGGNPAHPLNYTRVSTSLTNQNFLVIRAGDDTTAYSCPVDDPSTPYVNGNTYRHQPT